MIHVISAEQKYDILFLKHVRCMDDKRLKNCDVQDGCDSPPREKQEVESAVAMETSAEVTADQATKPSDEEKHSGADVTEAKTTSTKNIMFPSLSDEILSKIVDVRCHGDASKQSR